VVATPAATYCNVGSGAGQNHYEISYCLQDGNGITTLGQTAFAASTGVVSTNAPFTNIIGDSADGMMLLRADVDTDPIATDGYPRTEARELATDGTTKRSFDRTTGDHWIKVIFKILHLPPKKPSVVVVQMHDENDDIIEVVVQPVTGYNEITNPKVELVCRINGTSSGIPKLVADFQYNRVYTAKIRVGAIAAGPAVGWEAYIDNMVTPKITSSQAGMPAMTLTGTQNYFKWGCYLQTKSTGNGTGGLETDVNEYGESGYRDVQTFHNGETAPGVLSFGTQTFDTVSNVRWGTPAHGHQTVANSGFDMLPTMPSNLVNGDMMFCLVRASRGLTSTTDPTAATFTGIPVSITIASGLGWTRIISARSDPVAGAAISGAGTQLVAHNVRYQVWVKKWVNGDVAPTVSLPANGTSGLTDTASCQIGACSGSKYSIVLQDLIDKIPAGLDITTQDPADNNNITGITYGAATSTTLLGPTGTVTSAVPGALAIAMVTHETNMTSGGAAVVTGGADALTWAEAGEGVTTTITPAVGVSGSSEDEPAWANDWAIIPGSGAAVSIGAKTSAATLAADANKPNNTASATGLKAGKGWGVLFTIAPAKRVGRRRAN
jgi:hypothetical protein